MPPLEKLDEFFPIVHFRNCVLCSLSNLFDLLFPASRMLKP